MDESNNMRVVLNISLKCHKDLAMLYFTNMLTKTEQTVREKDVTLRVNPYFLEFYTPVTFDG